MSVNTTTVLYLGDLAGGIPFISPGKATEVIECCIWCLLENGHSNEVHLRVREGRGEEHYLVQWPERAEHDYIRFSYDETEATEHGAEAISFLLILERTDYTVIRRAMSPTGIDYWASRITDETLIFHESVRLEVSGILSESPGNTVRRRVRIKTAQTAPTDALAPSYVIVVEFSQPWSQMVYRNAHSE